MNFDRRSFLKASSAAIVGGAALSGSASASHVGVSDPVISTTDLNIREQPSTSASVKASADQWTGGHVVDGPRSADGYTWWKVSFNQDSDNGRITGWVAEGDAWLDGPTDFSYPCWGFITQTSAQDGGAIDIGNDYGTPLVAARGGTATTGYGDRCGYYVSIDHGGGWTSIYCHMQERYVSNGQTVSEGQQIGEMGSTGNSTGPHVHFAIRYNGANQNIPGFDGQDLIAGSGIPKSYL
ncbi:M23 family metallopeptidase [Halorussus salinus]|uniref:M23 family metallopeptidase n=1 Tax=Halorussus salinus TaxID=1364935 RepID=UPI001092AD71|nr:M23 family metallopeptidase [Halorussus salinus]